MTNIKTRNKIGTPRYYINTTYHDQIIREYDWHCVACSLLEIIGLIYYNDQMNCFTYQNTNVISVVHNQNYDENIHKIIYNYVKGLGNDIELHNISIILSYILNLGKNDEKHMYNISTLYELLKKYKLNQSQPIYSTQ